MSRPALLMAATIPVGMLASGLGAAVLVATQMMTLPGPLGSAAWLTAYMIFMATVILASPVTIATLLLVGVPLACWRGRSIAAAPLMQGVPVVFLGSGLGIAVAAVVYGRDLSPFDPDRVRIGLIFGATATATWVAMLRLLRPSRTIQQGRET